MSRQHIVSWSGGKDSTAMTIRMLEIGMPVDVIVFANTKKEFKAMHKFQRTFRNWLKANYPHVKQLTVQTKAEWNDWMCGNITRGKKEGEQRGWPLKLFPCWWTREAKFKMLDPICNGNYRYIGYAADEPQRWKSAMKLEGYKTPLVEWGWSEKDCLDYMKSKGIYCQLHLDFKRTGCYCCTKQSPKNLETIYRYYNKEWQDMIGLEQLAQNEWQPGISLKQVEDNIDDQLLFGFMNESIA